MTAKALRRFASTLPADAGWVLLALVDTPEGLTRRELEAELPGQGDREPKVRRAVAVLEGLGLTVRSDGRPERFTVKTDALASRVEGFTVKSDGMQPSELTETPPRTVRTDGNSTVRTDVSGQPSKVTEAKNAEQDEQKGPTVKTDGSEKSPLLLSINSLKEQDLKDKELKKPRAVKPKSSKGGSGGEPDYDPLSDPAVPGWVPAELWADFCAHRRGIKHPLTHLATKNLAGQLEGWRAELGEPAALESLRASIANGWRGVFKPKATAPPRKPVLVGATAKERENWSEEEWLR